MSLLEELEKEERWQEFLKDKVNNHRISTKEQEKLQKYIQEKRYLPLANAILRQNYVFSYPVKHLINKVDKSKKRVIYTFSEDETMILKMINYLLYQYDTCFSPNCYSFRKNIGVKQALKKITSHPKIDEFCSYKVDISNYFNSIPIPLLLPKLQPIIGADTVLYEFFKQLLENNKVVFQGTIIEEQKGIMAGVPISAFLANVYLTEMDLYFQKQNVLYTRYSDDIILFCKRQELEKNITQLEERIQQNGLQINEQKRAITKAGEKWEFLGFSYCNGEIDISDITKKKIKGKIKRASRKIRRWMLKKNAEKERALKAMNKKFNQKFYSYQTSDELTWSKWYFPILTTTKGLEEIDHYMQENLRYLVTGKYNKKNYEKVGYMLLKSCYYRSLVHEYYKQKRS